MAWRLQYDTMPQRIHDSILSNVRESNVMDEKPSMGEFFKMKSEDCSGSFMKQSPEKEKSTPTALISNIKNNIDENKSLADYNVSDIVRLLSNDSMSKSCLVQCLINRDCKSNQEGANYSSNDLYKKKQKRIEKTIAKNEIAENNLTDVNNASYNAKLHSKIPIIQLSEQIKRCPSPKLNLSTTKQQSSIIKSNNSPKNHQHSSTIKELSPQSKKFDFTDTYTFTSEKLLVGNSPGKSSLDDLSSDKENTASVRNVSPCGCISPNRSVTSLRSGSSLDCLIGGRVPIESTKIELVWATVKVGRSSGKEFVLRNKMHQKIRFEIVVTGSCFKITKPESESHSPLSILLHPLESRSFTVTFTPATIGAYADRLIFQPVTKTPSAKPTQKILLYGYGGHINPTIRSLLKDSTGKYWLPLGHIGDITTKHFSITNSGSLAAFVDVTVHLKYLQVFTGLTVAPSVAVLPVGATQQFQVKYVPNKDDLRRLKYGSGQCSVNVCEVAVIKCVFGAEVLRARIRRLIASKLDGQLKPSDALLGRIVQPIVREVIPADVGLMGESVASLKYLIQNLVSGEIVVTVEQDLDKTLVGNENDSTLFQTLCFEDSVAVTVALDVHPKVVVLCPRVKCSDVVFLVNSGDKVVCFEVRVTEDLVRVVPQSGKIMPFDKVTVKVTCRNDVGGNESLKLRVSTTEGFSCDVDVQIMCF